MSGSSKVHGWAATPLYWAGFAGTLLRYEVAGRLALRRSFEDFEWCMARLQRSLVTTFETAGMDIRVERDPAVAEHTPYVIISNHQSLLDIPLIGGTLYTNLPKYVAKQELASGLPAISLNLAKGGHALIDRRNPGQAIPTIEALGRRSQERGTSVVIFPEGTRSREGKVRRFKRAGTMALLAAASDLEVVPVAISGSWRLNDTAPFPVGEQVDVRIGAPIGRDDDDRSVFNRAVAWVQANVDSPGEE